MTTVFDDVTAERKRQIEKWGEQRHRDGTSPAWLDASNDACATASKSDRGASWLQILDEEVLEAFSETGPAKLREELIQVAATALAWVEDLDSRCPRP